MANTKGYNIEFGITAYIETRGKGSISTKGYTYKRTDRVKLIHKEDASISSGFRKVNFTDQKRKDAYKKINRMLGGN